MTLTTQSSKGSCGVLGCRPSSTNLGVGCFSENWTRPGFHLNPTQRVMPAPPHRSAGIKAIISCTYSLVSPTNDDPAPLEALQVLNLRNFQRGCAPVSLSLMMLPYLLRATSAECHAVVHSGLRSDASGTGITLPVRGQSPAWAPSWPPAFCTAACWEHSNTEGMKGAVSAGQLPPPLQFQSSPG